MKCPSCQDGRIAIGRVTGPWDPDAPDITADGLERGVCPRCGEVVTGVPRALELSRLALRALLDKPWPLVAGEIRLLRRTLGLTGAELGGRLAVNAQQVSRWENGRRPMPPAADRLLRMLVAADWHLAPPDLSRIDHASRTWPVAPLALHLHLARRGWRVSPELPRAAA